VKDRLIVVGVVGPARSGKDTVAKILELHAGFTRVALADPIKAAFDALGGAGRETHKELGGFQAMTVRRAWQLFGTEARQDIGCPLLWVDVALATIRYAEAYHARRRFRFVIPDVRYEHEHGRLDEAISAMGGHYESWGVDRGILRPSYPLHSSETSYGDVPTIAAISNSGTIADLSRIVLAEMETLIGSER
jgi:hypothetical protein